MLKLSPLRYTVWTIKQTEVLNISYYVFQGRQAIEWVIDKIEKEVADIKMTAAKSTDELKKSLTEARKSLDEFSTTAKKTFDDINFANNNGGLPEF